MIARGWRDGGFGSWLRTGTHGDLSTLVAGHSGCKAGGSKPASLAVDTLDRVEAADHRAALVDHLAARGRGRQPLHQRNGGLNIAARDPDAAGRIGLEGPQAVGLFFGGLVRIVNQRNHLFGRAVKESDAGYLNRQIAAASSPSGGHVGYLLINSDSFRTADWLREDRARSSRYGCDCDHYCDAW